MTKAELKQVLAVFDAVGVPDSAVVKHGASALSLSPVNLEGPGVVYTLDSEGHWQASSGSVSAVTGISFG